MEFSDTVELSKVLLKVLDCLTQEEIINYQCLSTVGMEEHELVGNLVSKCASALLLYSSHSAFKLQRDQLTEYESFIEKLLQRTLDLFIAESINLERLGTILSGLFQGIKQTAQEIKLAVTEADCKSNAILHSSFAHKIILFTKFLLTFPSFDVRQFLVEVPKGSRVEELLQDHYKFILGIFETLATEVIPAWIRNIQAGDSLAVEIGAILLSYVQVIGSFLNESDSNELFLLELFENCSVKMLANLL